MTNLTIKTPFKTFQGKPIERLAYEIKGDEPLTEVKPGNFVITVKNDDGQQVSIGFVTHEDVKVGDFVVYLNQEDVYHCSRKVFLERNEYPAKTIH